MADPKSAADTAALCAIATIAEYPALAHGWNELEDEVQEKIIGKISALVLVAIASSIPLPSDGLGK